MVSLDSEDELMTHLAPSQASQHHLNVKGNSKESMANGGTRKRGYRTRTGLNDHLSEAKAAFLRGELPTYNEPAATAEVATDRHLPHLTRFNVIANQLTNKSIRQPVSFQAAPLDHILSLPKTNESDGRHLGSPKPAGYLR
jgi:hypothetical protein